jgi:hypothetical protein
MTQLPTRHPLAQALLPMLVRGAVAPQGQEVTLKRLRASRPVFRFATAGGPAAVGKFFCGDPARLSADLALLTEYENYARAGTWGLIPGRHLPRLWGRRLRLGLGLLLEAVEGPDLDHFLHLACSSGDLKPLCAGLTRLARLLAFFHTRPAAGAAVDFTPALAYLEKLRIQLGGQGLLTHEEDASLAREAVAWARIFAAFPEGAVLVHGDATPTNFLFPDGRAVAVDLERLRVADRLFDVSWIAGEIRHAWGWRAGDLKGGEAAIGHFFEAYLQAIDAGPGTARRLFAVNPFYMALAELRICRNDYLSWPYRRRLAAEALECLAGGRRMTA